MTYHPGRGQTGADPAVQLDDNRRSATYSMQVQQRARTAAIQRSHQHTELPGMTAKRPAAPLVRDEEAAGSNLATPTQLRRHVAHNGLGS
jgi:hypothetical protein